MLRRMITALVHAERNVQALSATLSALVPAVVDGLIRDAVVIGQHDQQQLVDIAEAVGAIFVVVAERDDPWRRGAEAARGEWVLCLKAGDVLVDSWARNIERFLNTQSSCRFGRISRRGCSRIEHYAAHAGSWFGVRHLQPGDLAPRSLALAPLRRSRPTWIGALIERDSAFG